MATVAFACSTCGKQFRVLPEQSGRKVRCPHCEAPNSVPDGVFGRDPPLAGSGTQSPDRIAELSAALEQAPQLRSETHVHPRSEIRTSNKAVMALIFGVLGVVSLGLLGIPAIVLGVVATKEIDRSRGTMDGKGMAIWGIVLGALAVVGALLYVAYRFLLGATFLKGAPTSTWTGWG